MLKITDVSKLGNKYIAQSIILIIVLCVIVLSVALLVPVEGLVMPLIVSMFFSLAVNVTDGMVWKRVAGRSPESLPTFYTAVSGFRMLLALFTLFICYIVVGRDAMAEYCIVFLIYYFVLLTHHSVFFSHVSNSHSKCDKEN